MQGMLKAMAGPTDTAAATLANKRKLQVCPANVPCLN